VEHNKQNCYIKDVNFDEKGNPIILYVTSYGHRPGPQKWGQGGEVESWVSRNNGKSWKRAIRYTANSPLNHSYVRRPEYCKDPFWCFWADGNANVFSISHFFFADSKGNVYRLPYEMAPDQEWAKPEPMKYDFDAKY
jgi:hypothetical protein